MSDCGSASWSAGEALRIAAILATTRDAVMITDLAPKILAVNPAFTEIAGYWQNEIWNRRKDGECNRGALPQGVFV